MTVSKSQCRSSAQEILSSIKRDSYSFNLKSKLLRARLLDLLSSKKYIHNKIGGYYPLDDEINWLMNEGLNLSFPKILDDGAMVFKSCKIEELEEVRVFGRTFKEPPKIKEIVEPEVILVPGLAFDKTGNRLGRGKGFYDRYLNSKECKNKYITIGLCFDEQIIDKVPIDEFDIGMDFVVTDKKLIEIDNRRKR